MIRLFVVDDSAIVRQAFRKIADHSPLIEWLGCASDPIDAMEKLEKLGVPDVMILDIEMPRMNGLTYLQRIMEADPIPVIICSGVAEEGSENALRALSLGAVEIMVKPKLGIKNFLEEGAPSIIESIKAADLSRSKLTSPCPLAPCRSSTGITRGPLSSKNITHIAIGLSTGGVSCLETILQQLTPPLPPILVVQHMPKGFTLPFAKRLNDLSPLNVYEAEDGTTLSPSSVYIAPGHLHLSLREEPSAKTIRLQDGPEISGHKPSVDVLFRSLAKAAPASTAAFIMTGMGRDGADGLLELRKRGAYTCAQDESSSVVYGMPKAAVEIGAAGEVLPLSSIIERLCSLTLVS